MTGFRYRRNKEICTNCRFCITGVGCPSPQNCVGCGACYLACPNEAMYSTDVESENRITINQWCYNQSRVGITWHSFQSFPRANTPLCTM
ncbi:MAG: 4Fe-4S binding protein [Candidatus Thorarchaeota archaeon]